MTPQEHAQAATDLLSAERSNSQIGLLSLRYPDITMDDGLCGFKNEIYRQKLAGGRKVIGWKIGLTSKAMQYALNIDIPDSGILFDDMAFDNGANSPRKTGFIQPRVEAEIAFVMKSALAGENVTRKEVIEATDYVAPALEILDTRILRVDPASGKPRIIFDTISDNAANAGIVLGHEKHEPDAFDLRWVGAMTFRNDEIEETGLGAGVLNDPVESVVWLARRMAQYNQKIEAGQVILSGSFYSPDRMSFRN